MAVYELHGSLVLSPTSARAGGTLLEGVMEDVEDALTLLIPFRGTMVRTGLGAQGGLETRAGHEQPITLLVPFKNRKNLTQAKQMIFSHLTTSGTGMQPTGGTSTKAHATPASFAMIFRPVVEAEMHLYSPTWRIAEVADLQLAYGHSISHIEGNFLPLIANRAHGATTQGWMYDSYTNINTQYGWTEPS